MSAPATASSSHVGTAGTGCGPGQTGSG